MTTGRWWAVRPAGRPGAPPPCLPLHRRDDGGPGHAPAPFNYQSQAVAINNNGEVIGVSYSSALYSHAFLYSNGTMHDLGTLGGLTANADGINDTGQIVGGSVTSTGAEVGTLYSNGTMRNFSSLMPGSGWSEAGSDDQRQRLDGGRGPSRRLVPGVPTNPGRGYPRAADARAGAHRPSIRNRLRLAKTKGRGAYSAFRPNSARPRAPTGA